MTAKLNSSAPTTAEIVGGQYNATPPAPADGQALPLQQDSSGNLKVNVIAGGGSSNVNIANVAGSPPALSNPLPVELSDGTNAFGTSGNPLSENIQQWAGVAVAAPSAGGAVKIAPGVLTGSFTVQNAAGTPAGTTFTITTNDPAYSMIVLITDAGAGNGGGSSLFLECANNASAYTSWVSPPWGYNALLPGSAAVQNFFPGTTAWGVASTASTFTQLAFGISGFSYVRARVSSPLSSGTCTVRWVAFAEGQVPPVLLPALGYTGNGGVPDGTAAAYPITTLPTGTTNAVMPSAMFVNTTSAGNTLSYLRTPNIFKTASVSASTTGNSAVWTPTSGKKFRLMRFQITAQGLAATLTGVVTVSFQDSSTGITIGTYDVDVPAVANVVSGVNNISAGWIDLGNGFLSAAANNVLNFNISAAGGGTVGTYRINVCGTEE